MQNLVENITVSLRAKTTEENITNNDHDEHTVFILLYNMSLSLIYYGTVSPGMFSC
jgi:hypothetical protein